MDYEEVELIRDGLQSPWGLRIFGGVDHNSAITLARISPQSSGFGRLHAGDVICSINGMDTTRVTHGEAATLIANSGARLTLGVQRRRTTNHRAATLPRNINMPEKTPLPSNSQLASLMKQSITTGQKRKPRGLTTADLLARNLDTVNDITSYLPHPRRPYSAMRYNSGRTTPLSDTEGGRGSSRQAIGVWIPPVGAPSSRLVHEQYNSPMGLYTPSNIANMIEQQTGTKISWQRKPGVRFLDDITDSATYKFVHEMEEGENGSHAQHPRQSTTLNRLERSLRPLHQP